MPERNSLAYFDTKIMNKKEFYNIDAWVQCYITFFVKDTVAKQDMFVHNKFFEFSLIFLNTS